MVSFLIKLLLAMKNKPKGNGEEKIKEKRDKEEGDTKSDIEEREEERAKEGNEDKRRK